jgi:hypothetical protein
MTPPKVLPTRIRVGSTFWIICRIFDYWSKIRKNLTESFFVIQSHYFLGRWIIIFHFSIICDYCCIFVIIMNYFRLF